ncbi:hypothetical protein [Cohnella abietis]|uniref:Uncharacterized protein n=1 Tax=Cohnella abietis TaxID=2507935 RepID=A0A3T1D112_9BACL|nr:hypothetical protein [Cohnella abietis]BBI31774.1 hypothetical protein KCTCHS21_11730 [Cohnella abietis]
MRSYQKHLSHTSTPVSTAIIRKPTFRSSAIFPVFQTADITTRICFLGYWMVKRSIPEIQSVVTLRSKEGQILYRISERITQAKAYQIELGDLLAAVAATAMATASASIPAQTEFTGSLEIEFFSVRDLVFSYPAVVVNYYGDGFSSVVHTAQRIYNDAEDRSTNQEALVSEAGFNIYADGDREPFFSFINGFEPVRNGRVSMKFYNSKKETMDFDIEVPLLAPYETTIIYPDRHTDLQSFLNGQPGTARIRFDVAWIFPRIVAGNLQHSKKALSVTHTYYDCSNRATTDDYWHEPQQGWHAANMLIPLTLSDERYTHVNFYPIYSPSELEIDIELYDSEGHLLGFKSNAQSITPRDNRLQTLDLNSLIRNLGITESQPLSANLIARPIHNSRLPTRLKLGLDYGLNDSALSCNICKSMDVFNPALEQKRSSFHWAPIITDQLDSLIWIMNSSPMNPYTRSASITLTFYREQDTETIIRELMLAPNGSYCIRLSEHPELRNFLGSRIGWYSCVSDNPHIKTYYLSESSSGIVGGDHDF